MASKAPSFGDYLQQMNLDSVDSVKGRKKPTPSSATPQQRQLVQTTKEQRKQANKERYRRQMEKAAEVVELDPVRKEHRRKLGLDDESHRDNDKEPPA